MKLQVTINEEQFGQLAEDLQENYQPTDDGYVLSVEGMTHEDVSGLKSALQKERENRKTAEAAIEAMKADAKSFETRLHEGRRYQKRFWAAKRDSEINRCLSVEGGNPDLLSPLLRERVHCDEENGYVRYQVKAEDGTVLVGEDGQPVSVHSFVKSLKSHDAYKGSFRGTGQSGGNSFEGHSGGGIVPKFTPVKRRGSMTRTEKVDYINEHGQDAFNRLPL